MVKFKVLFLLTTIVLLSFSANAQRGVRIGYIDTEYILQNVPEYQEASTQLDKKVLKWKSEIEKRLNEIELKKKELNNESVLLTKELYDERIEDISFEEAEILKYQQDRFGPNGDLMIQKRQLIAPIQDQIFAAIQDIAETGKYDFVFDKSADDAVMLFSAERYDLSERVLKTITRASKRTQVKNKKERQELEDEEVIPVVSGEKDERQKALDERKATREAELATKRAEREAALEKRRKQQEEAREAKKLETAERRKKALEGRNKKTESSELETKGLEKDTTITAKPIVKIDSTKAKAAVKKDSTGSKKPKTAAQLLEEKRKQKLKEREERRKALEDRKKKIIEERKKAREEREKNIKKQDSIAKAKKAEDNEDEDNN